MLRSASALATQPPSELPPDFEKQLKAMGY